MSIAPVIRSLVPAFFLLVIATTTLRADDTDATAPGSPAAVDETHPSFSADARWVPPMLVAIGGLFLAALVVGRVVKTEASDLIPPASSNEHDSPTD